MLYIGKAPKGKFPHTWQLWDIKIPKPPYISSLKIIGFLHFLHFLDPSEKDYNLQSLMITLYKVIIIRSVCIAMSWLILVFVVTANILSRWGSVRCLAGEYLHLLGSGVKGTFEKYFRGCGNIFGDNKRCCNISPFWETLDYPQNCPP